MDLPTGVHVMPTQEVLEADLLPPTGDALTKFSPPTIVTRSAKRKHVAK